MKFQHYAIALFTFGCLACGADMPDYYPKPDGYLRLDFPERTYTKYETACLYAFEIPDYFNVIDKDSFCNMKDILMPRFNAQLNLTYIPVDTNLLLLIEKSRQLVYEHSQFADGIDESVIADASKGTYGIRYQITGDAASPYQFYLTDSTDHFLRGALYFNVKPNYDSVKASLDYIQEDLDHMLETVIWKNDSLK